jgi:hypothetical protein
VKYFSSPLGWESADVMGGQGCEKGLEKKKIVGATTMLKNHKCQCFWLSSRNHLRKETSNSGFES